MNLPTIKPLTDLSSYQAAILQINNMMAVDETTWTSTEAEYFQILTSLVEHYELVNKGNLVGLRIPCFGCGNIINEKGPLVWGPPDSNDYCKKYHFCLDCWSVLRKKMNTLTRSKSGEEQRSSQNDLVNLFIVTTAALLSIGAFAAFISYIRKL